MKIKPIETAFCFLTSLLFLAIATKSSPLYPFNDWVDANAIFTVGKGMMNGLVVYRDLFEQKGPLLYFIHGMGALISSDSFFGMYVMEVLFFTIFLVFCYKIFRLYLEPTVSLIGIPVLAAVVLGLTNFTHGDSAEEYGMAFLAISLYYLLDYVKNSYPEKMKFSTLLINGIVAGCILWIKYSMLGFWFGWMLFVFTSTVFLKHYAHAIKACVVFLGGMLVSGIPWFLYFGFHGAISDFIESYFLINIKYYSAEGSLPEHLFNAAYYVRNYLVDNPVYALFSVLGVAMLIFSKYLERTWIGKLAIIVPFSFLFLGVYGGGVLFIYYFLIFAPVSILGIIVFLKYVTGLTTKIPWKWAPAPMVAILFLVLWFTHHNRYLMDMPKEDLFQFKFAQTMKENKENPTLLNYGFLDLGVYLAADILPNVKHFQTQNINYERYPVNIDEQNRYIREQLVDFIVVRGDPFYEKQKAFLETYYDLVQEQKQFFEGRTPTYYLYKAKKK